MGRTLAGALLGKLGLGLGLQFSLFRGLEGGGGFRLTLLNGANHGFILQVTNHRFGGALLANLVEGLAGDCLLDADTALYTTLADDFDANLLVQTTPGHAPGQAHGLLALMVQGGILGVEEVQELAVLANELGPMPGVDLALREEAGFCLDNHGDGRSTRRLPGSEGDLLDGVKQVRDAAPRYTPAPNNHNRFQATIYLKPLGDSYTPVLPLFI
jgi:hypothetical protein